MRQQGRRLQALGAKLLAVTFQDAERGRRFVEEEGLEFPLLIDLSRSLYQQFGMGKGGTWDVWGPSNWWAYARGIRHGRLPKRPTGDIDQLGGDVLIDPSGTVRFLHAGKGPADRPPIETLISSIDHPS